MCHTSRDNLRETTQQLKQLEVGTKLSILAKLKKTSIQIQTVYASKHQIEASGGIFLLDTSSPGFFRGFVLDKSSNILHIEPGGGNMDFNFADFKSYMPSVALSLQEKGLTPSFYAIGGRHPGETDIDFIK